MSSRQPGGSLKFRRVESRDRPAVLALASRIWEGTDYLPLVFESWVNDAGSYFAGVFLDDDLIGCGRLMPFDRRRAWLEGLRIHPDMQGLGLGREMSHHLFRYGRDQGYQELHFSTYFGNTHSIRISEAAGFTAVASFSHLELDLTRLPGDPAGAFPGGRNPLAAAEDSAIRVLPGIPEEPVPMWNDWLHVPGDLEGRRSYFPNPLTVVHAGCTLVLADNLKYTGTQLEVCRASGCEGAACDLCIRFALREALARGCSSVHIMLPAEAPLDPWLRFGFAYSERALDVFLYRCRTSELRV
jgi:GNAT superfamily N-acetyltransferase